MKKNKMTDKQKKEMAKLLDITVDELEKRLEARPAPSTSDSLFQNIREDEEQALTSIHMKLFRQEMQRSDD